MQANHMPGCQNAGNLADRVAKRHANISLDAAGMNSRDGRACSWRGTLLDLMLEMAGKLMLAKDPRATAAMESAFVPANATNSCCTQLTAMPARQQLSRIKRQFTLCYAEQRALHQRVRHVAMQVSGDHPYC